MDFREAVASLQGYLGHSVAVTAASAVWSVTASGNLTAVTTGPNGWLLLQIDEPSGHGTVVSLDPSDFVSANQTGATVSVGQSALEFTVQSITKLG